MLVHKNFEVVTELQTSRAFSHEDVESATGSTQLLLLTYKRKDSAQQ